jgi:hypothetical protein
MAVEGDDHTHTHTHTQGSLAAGGLHDEGDKLGSACGAVQSQDKIAFGKLDDQALVLALAQGKALDVRDRQRRLVDLERLRIELVNVLLRHRLPC